MDALEEAKRNILWAEEWRSKVNGEADQEMADHYGEMEAICRADAQAYAAIAQAEAALRQAAALERIADYVEGYAALYLDGAVTSVADERWKARERREASQ